MRTFREAVGLPLGLPASRWKLEAGSWKLEIGARLMGTETELVLKSRWV